jgi:hypothetical protein
MKPYNLIYVNGDKQPKPPQIKEIRISKDATEDCAAAREITETLPKKIRNDTELAEYRDGLAQVREVIANLEATRRKEREPYTHILQQIETVIVVARQPLEEIEHGIRAEIERFEAQRRFGTVEEIGKLEAKAAEEEQRARYAESPKTRQDALMKKRQYQQTALELKKEAKTAGIAVHIYWEPQLTDAALAVRKNPEFLTVEVNEGAIQAYIKEKERAGVTITEYMIPGIRLIKRSKMTMRK